MQYKKKEVYEQILEAGRNEYALKGYRGGNIGTIAQKAGVPVGNLYRYFDGKTGLLDAIVRSTYVAVPALIDEMREIAGSQDGLSVVITKAYDFISLHHRELLILSDRCTGTRYDSFLDETINKIAHGYISRKENPNEDDVKLAEYTASAFTHSIFKLIRENLDRRRLKKMIELLVKFYFCNKER